jgi:predicted lipoprotein with Yx(FWY)xxD motif
MTRNRRTTLLASAAVLPLVAVVVAGCGGGGGGAASASKPALKNGRAATIGVANGGLGNILVDSQGRTLYLFKKDSGSKSACVGECATDWPPLRATAKPTAGNGANASLLATAARSDGMPGITYNGHPVYLFEGDKRPGDTNGQGLTAFGGGWFVLSPQGRQTSGQPGSGTGSSSGGASAH